MRYGHYERFAYRYEYVYFTYPYHGYVTERENWKKYLGKEKTEKRFKEKQKVDEGERKRKHVWIIIENENLFLKVNEKKKIGMKAKWKGKLKWR